MGWGSDWCHYACLRSWPGLPRIWEIVVLLLVTLATTSWVADTIAPDVIVAALLTSYFALTCRPALIQSPRCQLFTGGVVGLAYLAKAYALPFFLGHYTASVLFYALTDRTNSGKSQALRSWLLGIVV